MQTSKNGIAYVTCTRSVRDTLAQLLTSLEAKAVTIFAVVDHSGEAAKAGIEMHDTKLVIFGNPQAGTPIMLAAPDSALDLPLKLLIAEGADGNTKISYNSPAYLQARYELAPELVKTLAVVEQIAAQIATQEPATPDQ